MQHVNYKLIADKNNQRFHTNSLAGVVNSLVQLIREVNAKMMLEVGYGMGRWLDVVAKHFPSAQFCEMNYAQGMLAQVQDQSILLHLIRGKGSKMPFKAHTIDLLFCANVLHYFIDPKEFHLPGITTSPSSGKFGHYRPKPHDRRNRRFVFDYVQEHSNEV